VTTYEVNKTYIQLGSDSARPNVGTRLRRHGEEVPETHDEKVRAVNSS